MRSQQLRVIFVLLVNLAISYTKDAQENEKFTEELYIKPLPNGDLLAHFSFDITSSQDLKDAGSIEQILTHFDLMPKVVGEFLTDHALEGKIGFPQFRFILYYIVI